MWNCRTHFSILLFILKRVVYWFIQFKWYIQVYCTQHTMYLWICNTDFKCVSYSICMFSKYHCILYKNQLFRYVLRKWTKSIKTNQKASMRYKLGNLNLVIHKEGKIRIESKLRGGETGRSHLWISKIFAIWPIAWGGGGYPDVTISR